MGKNVYMFWQQIEAMCQVSSESPKFYKRYYRKHFGLFFQMRCICCTITNVLFVISSSVLLCSLLLTKITYGIELYHVIRFSGGSLQVLLMYKSDAINSYYFKSLPWLD